jgi:hypothetical protein
MIIDGFKEKIDLKANDQSEIFMVHNEDFDKNLKQKGIKEKNFLVRHSRSVTKILPFKFAEKNEKLSL